VSTEAAAEEFATRLAALGVSSQRKDAWLVVGNPRRVAGWKLHVSATIADVDLLFERVLPCLVRHGAHFKMAAERDAIVHLNAGNFGETQIGKVITVYPRNNTEAVALARELIEHTCGIVGPRVATDLHLGEAVYTRYGSVRPRIMRDRFGEPTELIPDGNGNWMRDLRPVPFSCPQGIAIPFPAAASAQVPARPKVRRLLGGRYFVTDVLRPGLAGSVLRAIDVGDERNPAAYVLKQARPHCCADELGRDRRARLRHEGAVLARLRGLTGIASAGEYFEEEEIGYLPVAYVPGQTLGELIQRLVTGRSWRRVRAPARRRLLHFAAELVRRLSSAHARGVIHRDVAPGNAWIGHDDCVYLLDWECAHVVGSRTPSFRLGTPSFSDLSREQRAPACRDDWQACGRVFAFMLTGLDPAAVIHGQPRELATRLAELTELRDSVLIDLLARTLADQPSGELDAATLLDAIASTACARTARRQHSTAPLFTVAAHESVLTEGLEMLTAGFRVRLDRVHVGRKVEAAKIDAHAGIAGLLYVLAAAHGARVAHLDTTLGERAARILTARTPITPDLPGLVHGRAGRALAVAAAVHAGCVSASDALRTWLADALAGRLDWPDFTHGAAGQGFAALACARRLGVPQLAAGAAACAIYLVRTQNPEGSWTLPEGVHGASGERYTGFAHGAAGMMGFLGGYAALTNDAAADAAWRRAEAWLVNRARRGRAGRWHWPLSDSRPAPSNWWCHGAPGIALAWLCVAQAQGTAAVAEEYLRRALEASSSKLRSDSLGQCHGLAGVGEVYLEAYRVLGEECWRERAADISKVLVALFRRRPHQPWHYLPEEPGSDSDGLMLGTAGILHFLLRHHHPAAVTSAPLLA
jgi:Lanthionine synthetase C-like protein/Protein kinase domain